jgi:hypothetical protein
MKQENVFISWSGDRSEGIARAFFDWLPMVIQSAKPWMSGVSIDKGSRGLVEIANALDGIRVGVTFLTPENLSEPWILYEAGCLTKTVNDKTRLCTYLLGGLEPKDVEPPLSQFQHTKPEKEDTLALIRTINKAVNEEPIPEKTLEGVFERLWPDLDAKLKALPPTAKVIVGRSTEDMVAEILELTRATAQMAASNVQVGITESAAPILRSFGSHPPPLPDFIMPVGERQASNNAARNRAYALAEAVRKGKEAHNKA